VRRRQEAEEFRVTGVAERLAAYETSDVDVVGHGEVADPELVERAATLLAVMPRNQLRATIEGLLSPNDHERGRRAVDALIDAAFAIEDETGHIRKAD
jgi:hypothetical protein